MKNLLFFGLLVNIMPVKAQNGKVESRVYEWNKLKVETRESAHSRQIIEGRTLDLDYFKVLARTLPSGVGLHSDRRHEETEELIIIKEGYLTITLAQESKILSEGSIAVIMPGDDYRITNIGELPATYYLFRFKSGKQVNKERGAESGGSFMVDFNDLEFKPHDKGGLWEYYRRSTAMFDYAEMHVTKLNGNIKSHEPHTHGAAEIVLMISGSSEMQIGDTYHQASAGDLYYLESEVPHAIQNTGDEPCKYFAFQWQ